MWYSGLRDKYHSEKWFTSWTLLCNQPQSERQTCRSIWIITTVSHQPANWCIFLVLFLHEAVWRKLCVIASSGLTSTSTPTHTYYTHLKPVWKYLQYSQGSQSPVVMEETHTYLTCLLHLHRRASGNRKVVQEKPLMVIMFTHRK